MELISIFHKMDIAAVPFKVVFLCFHFDDFIYFFLLLYRPFIEAANYETYLNQMLQPQAWGGQIELQAMSHMFHVNFVIYSAKVCVCSYTFFQVFML